jgi:hypothetical protein
LAISYTANWYSALWNAININYSFTPYYKKEDEVKKSKKCQFVKDKFHHIIAPPIFNTRKNRATEITESIANYIKTANVKQLHFTHFGFIKNQFPSEHIEQTLKVFLLSPSNMLNKCQIYFDIDEEYYLDVSKLIANIRIENN